MKTPPDAVTATYALTPEIERTGEQLRRALRPIVEEAGGQPPRTGRLGRRLGIDKSLASRLVRAVSGESNLELVHRVRVQVAVGGACLANEAQPLVGRQGLRLVEDLLQGLGGHWRILRPRRAGCPSVG